MIKKSFLYLFLPISINILWIPNNFAATVSNSFIFIENNVDDEYFITSQKLNPRFSGSNKYTRYASKQRSLGYMGTTPNSSIKKDYNVDIWLENSPIDNPFLGNRCLNDEDECPSDGIWPAKYIEKSGAYMINQNSTKGQSTNTRPIFSDNSFNFFKDMGPDKTITLSLRSCQTEFDYNPSQGESCESIGGKMLSSNDFVMTKIGHLQLLSTNALQEIFIDSNGMPNIGLGSEFCQTATVNGRDGIVCNLVQYKYTSSSDISKLRVGLKLNPTYITYDPNVNDVMFQGNVNSNWYTYTRKDNPTTKYTDVFDNTNNGQLSVFLSQSFLKQLIDRNVDLTNSQDFFTFSFYNSSLTQSGYYEFTPSNKLIIKPRNYGISIIPADFNPNPKKTGKVGSDHPITFNYIVTTTGFRQANNITAQVIGDNQIINNQSYCIFSSSDNSLQVPFSAYLSFKTKSTGKTISNRASCDSKKISLNNALWTETPWDVPAQDQGSYYRTNLDLTFPMNEGPSYWSLEGDDWIGSVTGSGSVKVTATWTGPDVTQ
ncbi:fimbrial protein [Moellerella wisconsensis]|uniref:fimbrial protein n=1 Tax=Moellerella wisconsensis TaxID=158849 RepID=UPI00307654E2